MDACCEPVLLLDEAVNTALVRDRNLVTETENGLKFVRCPLKLSDSPLPEEIAAPDLGADNQKILGHLGFSPDDLVSLKKRGII